MSSFIKQRFDELTQVEPRPEQEPIAFSVEIPGIRIGELGDIITVYIDGERVGELSNFHEDYNSSIDIDEIKPGVHEYKLNVRIYTFMGYQHYYNGTVTGRGQINVEDGDIFVVANGASAPSLLKY